MINNIFSNFILETQVHFICNFFTPSFNSHFISTRLINANIFELCDYVILSNRMLVQFTLHV